MKKIALFAGITILALAMGACMFFEDPNGDKDSREMFDEYGRKQVEISIITGNESGPRNMSLEMAQAAINYYEVLFKDDLNANDVYIRAAGPRGKILVVRLSVGQKLALASDAIVFAGYWDKDADQRTLLATGIATETNWDGTNGDPVAAGVVAATYNIRFQLSPIETQFHTVAASSFKVTQAGYATNNDVDDDAHIANHILVNGKRTPVYKLPVSTVPLATNTGSTATFTYTIPTAHRAGIYTLLPDTVGGTGNLPTGAAFPSWSLLTDNPDDGLVICRAILTTPTNLPGPLPATINLRIYTGIRPSANGFVMIFPNFTVYPIDEEASDPDKVRSGGAAEAWGLRNGIHFYLPHDNQAWWESSTGPAGMGVVGAPVLDTASPGGSSLGGGVLLQIGESAGGGGRVIRIIIDGPPPS